jgi:hypothetical protein
VLRRRASRGPASEGAREGIAGARAALPFAAGALQARLGVREAAGTDGAALTAGTREGPSCPAQRREGRLTRFGIAAVVAMRPHRHRCVSPWITRSVQHRSGDTQLTIACVDRDTPRAMERPDLSQGRLARQRPFTAGHPCCAGWRRAAQDCAGTLGLPLRGP